MFHGADLVPGDAHAALYRQEGGVPGDAAGAAQAYSSADGTDGGWQDFERLDRDDARPEVAVCSFEVGTAHPRKPHQTRFVVCDWTPVSNEINHLRAGSVELKWPECPVRNNGAGLFS